MTGIFYENDKGQFVELEFREWVDYGYEQGWVKLPVTVESPSVTSRGSLIETWPLGSREWIRQAIDRHEVAKKRRRYRVDYNLLYDGSQSEWSGYYRFRVSTWFAIPFNRFIQSWGGSAKVYDQRSAPKILLPQETRRHLATYFYDEGSGRGDDREGYRCWCGWLTLGNDKRTGKSVRDHNFIGVDPLAASPRRPTPRGGSGVSRPR